MSLVSCTNFGAMAPKSREAGRNPLLNWSRRSIGARLLARGLRLQFRLDLRFRRCLCVSFRTCPHSVVLLVAHLLHPLHSRAVAMLRNGDVRHGRVRRRAVPVLLTGGDPHDVSGSNLLNGIADR